MSLESVTLSDVVRSRGTRTLPPFGAVISSSWIRRVGNADPGVMQAVLWLKAPVVRCLPKVEGRRCGEMTGLATGSRRGGPSKDIEDSHGQG